MWNFLSYTDNSKIKLKIGAIPSLNLPAKSIAQPSIIERPPPRDRKLTDKIYHGNYEDLKRSVTRYLPKSWEFKEKNGYLLIHSSVNKLGMFPTHCLKIDNSFNIHGGYCGWFTANSPAIQSIDVRKMTVSSMLATLSGFSVCGGISYSGKDLDLTDYRITLHHRVVYHHTEDADSFLQPPTLQLIAARFEKFLVFDEFAHIL